MSLIGKLDKIDSEIEIGLKFKAADRLRNLIQDNPNEIELWNKLAELYYESGFLDAAGKYWIFTEPTDDRIEKCVEIYEKSVNYSGYQILQEIVFRGDKSKLTEFAQKKMSKLEADSLERANYVPEFKPRSNKLTRENEKFTQTFRHKLVGFAIMGAFGMVIVLVLIGCVSVIEWIFE